MEQEIEVFILCRTPCSKYLECAFQEAGYRNVKSAVYLLSAKLSAMVMRVINLFLVFIIFKLFHIMDKHHRLNGD